MCIFCQGVNEDKEPVDHHVVEGHSNNVLIGSSGLFFQVHVTRSLINASEADGFPEESTASPKTVIQPVA